MFKIEKRREKYRLNSINIAFHHKFAIQNIISFIRIEIQPSNEQSFRIVWELNDCQPSNLHIGFPGR